MAEPGFCFGICQLEIPKNHPFLQSFGQELTCFVSEALKLLSLGFLQFNSEICNKDFMI